MKLHELMYGQNTQDNQKSNGMNKLAAEQIQYIEKRAGEILEENNAAMALSDQIAKIAAEEIDNTDFSDPAISKVAAELLSYGAGLADGEAITKAAMAPAIYEDAYHNILSKIAEVLGPEAADAVDGAMREAGGEEQAQADEIGELHAEIAENVAAGIVEQAGGMDAVSQDPELAKDIMDQAGQVASQIIEENLQG